MGAGRGGSDWVWFGFDLIQHEFIDTEEHWILTDALKGKRNGGEIGWGLEEVRSAKGEVRK